MLYYSNPIYYRRGAQSILDENWETILCYNQYGVEDIREINYNQWSLTANNSGWVINEERCPASLHGHYSALSNPMTVILDAYNGYYSTYNESDSNNTPYKIIENTDNDIFEARLAPKGSLTLFRSRNPITGDINIMPFSLATRAGTNGVGVPGAL
jgi:hypothetical protein